MNKRPNQDGSSRRWQQLPVDEVLRLLDTDGDNGLTKAEVRRRSQETGPNELIESRGRGILSVFIEQVTSPMVIVLLACRLRGVAPLKRGF